MIRVLMLLSLLVTPLPAAPAPRSVVTIEFAHLVELADVIVIARVDRVDGPKGAEVAEATVESIWKGAPGDTVRYGAHSTWSCDVSGAEFGERAVLFLTEVDAELGYRLIEHSGRGRMRLREVDGRRYATLQAGGLKLPTNIVTRDLELDRFPRRSLALPVFTGLVRDTISQQRIRALAAARADLLEMLAVDRRVHDAAAARELDEAGRHLLQVAAESHAARLQAIVTELGWPDRARFGDDAVRAAFTLVRRADDAPELQAAVLPQLEQAAERDELPRADVARFVDRVRATRGEAQRYGTHYAVATDAAGAPITDARGRVTHLLPLVDNLAGLDARRAAAGLRAWADDEREIAAAQGREPAARPRVAGD